MPAWPSLIVRESLIASPGMATSSISCFRSPHVVESAHIDIVELEIDRPILPGAEFALASEEYRRASRFVFDRDRLRFVNSRLGLRAVLAACLGIPPRSVAFRYGPYGKPELAPPYAWLRFNLSHSGDRALVGLALEREVGVDIEQVRQGSDAVAIAYHFFTARERASIQRATAHDRSAAFYRLC